jgi:hypothetical protein
VLNSGRYKAESWAPTTQPNNHQTVILTCVRNFNFEEERMNVIKVIRNILGTAGLIYAGYVLIASVKDVRRYIRISSM